MSLLLDTHAIIWALQDDARLGKNARVAIEQLMGKAVISDISLLEISMLINRSKKIKIAGSTSSFLTQVTSIFDVKAIDSEIADDATSMKLGNADPFDRVIVATARRFGLSLLTKDKVIKNSRLIPTIW